MNQILAASIGLILALFLWSLGKKIPKTSKTNFINDFEQKKSLVESRKTSQISIPNNNKEIIWIEPKNTREKINLRKKLFKLISLDPENRLNAVDIASRWGDLSVLPIIRRGLKDADSRVVIAAAKGIQQYKKQLIHKFDSSKTHLPLNIFLMR